MAKYCNADCHAVCDFCKHYKDYRTDGKFEGSGTCTKKNIEVDASNYCEDDFECLELKSKSL